MKKYFILCLLFFGTLSLYAEKVSLKVNNSFQTIEVNDELFLGYGNRVSEIKFENKVSGVSKIILEGTAFLKDYSFISSCKNLEVLVMNNITVDNFDFLLSCKQLKVLALDSIKCNQLPYINEFKKLEYFALTNSDLELCDSFINHGQKLKFINLSYNKISKLPKLNSDDNSLYFVTGNLVKPVEQKNYIFCDDISKNLPKEFMEYIR